MNLGLEKQVVFIAGSSRGIGRAIGEALLAEGATVVLTGRNEVSLNAVKAELESAGNDGRIMAIAGDFCDPAVIAAAFERTIGTFGKIDHLIANLGSGSGKPGWDYSHDEWARFFELNFFASTRLTQAVLPYLLLNRDGGSIIYIASIVAVEATAAPLPYSAAKAALVNYSMNLARQMGPHKIRVNSIAPGNIWFPNGSWDKHLSNNAVAVKTMLDSEVPLQRFGSPQEIAAFVAYLCSAQAAFCTGACYVIDGGQTRSR